MVDDLVMATTNTNDVASAWRSLVKPTDKVGIKISAAGGKYFSTHKSVVEAIVEGLESAGISRKDVIVWDREGLAAAGYVNRPGGYQVRSIEPIRGYDSQAIISSAAEGKLIWGDVDFLKKDPTKNPLSFADRDQISADSHVCKILSHDVTKIINVPVFSSSETAGVAGALYNVTVPNVDNSRRFSDNDSFIPDLYSDPRIGPKVVINIMDGLMAQYAGGPEFQPNYAIRHCMLLRQQRPRGFWMCWRSTGSSTGAWSPSCTVIAPPCRLPAHGGEHGSRRSPARSDRDKKAGRALTPWNVRFLRIAETRRGAPCVRVAFVLPLDQSAPPKVREPLGLRLFAGAGRPIPSPMRPKRRCKLRLLPSGSAGWNDSTEESGREKNPPPAK